jgi:hypothetical protein
MMETYALTFAGDCSGDKVVAHQPRRLTEIFDKTDVNGRVVRYLFSWLMVYNTYLRCAGKTDRGT